VFLLELLQKELSPSIDHKRFDWLYRRCPSGEASAWLATEEKTGQLVGAAAVFPRKMNLNGQIENGCVLGDFCVSAAHRSLGPALQLQRRCLESVTKGPFKVGFDLPSASMLAVYERLGIKSESKLVRMTKLLRLNAKVAARVKPRMLARGVSIAANAVLSVRRDPLSIKSGVSIERHTSGFGSEFSDLAERVRHGMGSWVERSAEYLNWRYLDHPHQEYEVLTARRGRRLEGYLVFLQQGNSASVVDCAAAEPIEVRNDLIRGLTALMKDRKVEAIHAAVLASHPFCGELERLGFRSRESTPVVFLRGSGVAAHSSWFLMNGDRES
jgi:hypothetical protein